MSIELTADAHPADSPTSGVFLSYRREETKHVAGRLADRIAERFTSSQIFVDVDSIPPGVDFTRATQEAIDRSGVLLALIGPRWTTIEDAEGRRRLDDPEDFVVLELRAALELGIPVIPVLVDGAQMPKAAELPPGMEHFSLRNAVRLDAETFRRDVDWLLTQLAKILPAPSGEASEPRPAPRRLMNRRAALRLAGALVVAAAGAGVWGVSKLVGSDPGAPQGPIDTRILAVKQQAPATLADYLRDTNKATGDLTHDQLSQTGRVYALTIQLRGERGSKFPLRWFMTDADRATRLRQNGYDQVPVIFRPRTDNHRRTWPVWIPPPPYAGRFRVTFRLENAKHEPVDQKMTPVFRASER
jgi:hypothetical protein